MDAGGIEPYVQASWCPNVEAAMFAPAKEKKQKKDKKEKKEKKASPQEAEPTQDAHKISKVSAPAIAEAPKSVVGSELCCLV